MGVRTYNLKLKLELLSFSGAIMRRITIALLTGVATALGGQGASGAELAVKAAPPRPSAQPWTGPYIGLNAGWVGADSRSAPLGGTDNGPGGLGTLLSTGLIPSAFDLKPNGFIGGGQIGYNWQFSNWVFGFEGDFDGTSLKRTQTQLGYFPLITTNYSQTLTRELEWLATVRGRVGVTWAHVLFYGTAGLAVGQTKIGLTAIDLIDPVPPLNASSTNNNIQAGWTIGGGAEWKLSPQWSLKAEYLYVDLGAKSSTVPYAYSFGFVGINNSSLTVRIKEQYNIARAGVNLSF